MSYVSLSSFQYCLLQFAEQVQSKGSTYNAAVVQVHSSGRPTPPPWTGTNSSLVSPKALSLLESISFAISTPW